MTDDLERRRLRRDVTKWARRLGFTPQMAVADPETIIDFIGACIDRYPDQFSHEHGCEIFRWTKEYFPYPYGDAQ